MDTPSQKTTGPGQPRVPAGYFLTPGGPPPPEVPRVTSDESRGTGREAVLGPDGLVTAAGLTLREAEELLDWLEANGYRERELAIGPGEKFTVRWRA
jgi:hypothetical protein